MAETTTSVVERPSPAPAPPSTAGRGFSPWDLARLAVGKREFTVVIVTLATILYFAIAQSAFISTANIITICQYMAVILVIGFGEVPILVLGEIDLSAGAVYISAPWFVYFFWSDGMPFGWAIAAAMAACIAIGAFNGLAAVWLRVPTLIVTLAVNYILFGIVLVASNATQVDMPGTTGAFGIWFGIGSWSTILWSAAIGLAIWALLKRTAFGVSVVATGGNLLAAAEAGIAVRRVKVMCFIIIAAGSAWIGILDGIRIESINPGNSGLDYALPGIVAAVLGGTALQGGRGTIVGTAIGAIFLAVLEDGLNVIGVNAYWFYFAEGVMILVAMAANAQLGALAARLRR